MSTTRVNVSTVKQNGHLYYQGIVKVQGLAPTKLTRLNDSSTRFETLSALISAAKGLASRTNSKLITSQK